MHRWIWISVPLGFVVTLVAAFSLTPAASGMGTHQQLGLPDCWFHNLTQLPCPGCGLTTSFVQLVHGQLAAACKAHPLGPLFLALFAWGSACSLLEFFGISTAFGALLDGKHFYWVGGGVTVFMLVWLGRLYSILSI